MNPVNAKPYALPPDAIWLSTAPHTLHPSHYPNTQSTNNPVTGCSSGIGQSLAALLASKPNQRLIATARNPSTLSYLPDSPNILKLALDVTSPSSVDAAFATAAEHFGDEFHLDVVVNNAGYSLSGDTEAAAEEEAHLEMETLFFGTARVTTRALPIMRKEVSGRRGGVIFNISSLAGLCGFPGHAYYHAGKFAVEGWSESVAREVHPNWNVNICIVEPSGVKSNFDGHSKARIHAHPDYAGEDMPARQLEKYVNMGIKSGIGMMEPSAVAETLWNVASRGEKVPLRLPLGATCWKMVKAKCDEFLRELEVVKRVSTFGQDV